MILLILLVMSSMLDHEPSLEPIKLLIISRQPLLAPTELDKPNTFLDIHLTQNLPEILDDLTILCQPLPITSVSSK